MRNIFNCKQTSDICALRLLNFSMLSLSVRRPNVVALICCSTNLSLSHFLLVWFPWSIVSLSCLSGRGRWDNNETTKTRVWCFSLAGGLSPFRLEFSGREILLPPVFFYLFSLLFISLTALWAPTILFITFSLSIAFSLTFFSPILYFTQIGC